MHTEMSKINRLVAEHATKQQELADENFLTETEFVERLKELEANAVATEAKIVAFKEEKEGLLLDTLEAEKQTQLLEKKIALERETQAALDPEVGAAEVRAMQREIHRMRLRHAQLQKRQETMIADMERAIYKRDNIEAKGKVLAQKKGMPPTKAALQKQTSELTRKLKLTTHDANLAQMSVLKLQDAQRERGQIVEGLASEVSMLRLQRDRVQSTLDAQQQQHFFAAPSARPQPPVGQDADGGCRGRVRADGRPTGVSGELDRCEGDKQSHLGGHRCLRTGAPTVRAAALSLGPGHPKLTILQGATFGVANVSDG